MSETGQAAGMTSSSKKRKRQWKDLPAFMDASATVSVGLFGSRRLPELKAMYSAVTKSSTAVSPNQTLTSGGAKTSSRHLRRRTTAVERSKHRHRYPSASKLSQSTTRKARRGKQSSLCQGHFEWQKGYCIQAEETESPSNVHWVTSHLWHTKRFHMESLWGWRVPLWYELGVFVN